MKYTQLGIKTNKSGKDYDSVNATYLVKGGYIDQVMAGVFTFLPLGLRVLNKIERIIRDEMDKIGTEILMPALSPEELWQQTGRLNTVDVLYGVSGANQPSKQKNDAHYVLNSTHEEVVTPISMKHNRSYKDLPIAFYQIQTKYRNEARPKSGLLRCREFRMKDLYSFHRDEADLKRYYEQAKESYFKVYERLGLKEVTYLALASGGDFTKDYSHEFQVRCETGEDILFLVPSTGIAFNREVAPAKTTDFPQDGEQKPMEAVYGENVTGMDELTRFLHLPAHRCVKTLIYETDDGRIIAAAVRGDNDVAEAKLLRATGAKRLKLATSETVERVTGAKVGYAGLIGLSDEVEVYADDALAVLVNFECGANRTDYHNINVNWDRDVVRPENFADIKEAREGDVFPETGETYEVFKASEVGNIFPLQTKFSKAFGYRYIDEQGQEQPVFMGSYGIGPSRVMGVLVERFHDDKGIIWPAAVAPFQVHLVSLRGGEEKAQALYERLRTEKIEVLWDDRDESPGTKFADADLIGIPVRLVVSARTGDQVEFKRRSEQESMVIDINEAVEKIKNL